MTPVSHGPSVQLLMLLFLLAEILLQFLSVTISRISTRLLTVLRRGLSSYFLMETRTITYGSLKKSTEVHQYLFLPPSHQCQIWGILPIQGQPWKPQSLKFMPLGSVLGSSLCADSSHLLVPSTPSFTALSSDHCLPFLSCFSAITWLTAVIYMDEPHTTLASQSFNLSCFSSFQPLTLMVTSLPQSLLPRSQLKASHSPTTISCLSSKSALGFPCLPLFLFSSCRYLAP